MMKSKKYMNRILSFLTIICCLAGCVLTVLPARAEDSVPRAVFTNEPNEAPDLYVTKELQNAESYKGNPDELRFSFILKLNGKTANKQEYTIIRDGEEEKEEGRVKVYQTESGRFTLAPGQTAWFKNLVVGTQYEVTESDMPASFQQTEPEGGAAAAGFITAEGVSEKFVNRYIPDTPGKTTVLKVSKTISFPSGFAAPETPEFHFILTLDGEPYALESYTITDDRTGKYAGTAMTDENGGFTLKGGYTASFTKVKAGVDYKLEETELPDGWRVTGSAVLEGATKAPETPLIMNNASASFAVSKQVKGGGSKDAEFTFLLTREDHSVWAGASYYLYNLSTGELAEESPAKQTEEQTQTEVQTPEDPASAEQAESGNPARTREDGTFTLKHGQAAVFIGIEPGTVYSVREIGSQDYTQTLPLSVEGYKDSVVTDSVIMLPFENEYVDNRGALTVTKQVENVKGDAPESQENFRFRLTKITKSGIGGGEGTEDIEETGEVVAGAVYSIAAGGSEKTYRTDKDGIFTIKADETARFGALPFGTYQVEELDLPEGYEIKETVQIKDLTRDNSAAFNFANGYRADRLDLHLVKQNRREEVLEGVSFKLWKAADGTPEDAEWEDIQKTEAGTFRTDAEGKLTIPGLESGIYYLQEMEAAAGYMPWEKPLRIVITRDVEDRSKVTVQAEGWTASIPDAKAPEDNPVNENPDAGEIPRGNVVKTLTLTEQEGARDIAELTVINEMFYELPNSGGMGIFPCILLGLVLMMAACMLYFRRNRTA